jgi:hypothetical protein
MASNLRLKKMMQNIRNRDSNGGLIVGVLSFSLLTMATFAVERVFRVFRRRKVRVMKYRNDSLNASAAAPARSPEVEQESSECIPSASVEENDSRLTMYASEAVLRRYWDTPEEDDAWAHL